MKNNEMMKKISLTRPVANRTHIDNGTYIGRIVSAEIREFDCSFNKTGKRHVLNIKVEVQVEGEIKVLYVSPNYKWSEKAKMVKLLDDIGALPEPGQKLVLEDLVGIPVRVMVENVEKNGETYSNITRMKRNNESNENGKDKKVESRKKTKKKPVKKKFADEIGKDSDNNSEQE